MPSTEEPTNEQKAKAKEAKAGSVLNKSTTTDRPGPTGPDAAPENRPPTKAELDAAEQKRFERLKTKDPAAYQRITESRKILNQPLQSGQQLYETPDGEILVGEEGRGQIWARSMNNGKGGWANPMRLGTINQLSAEEREQTEVDRNNAEAERLRAPVTGGVMSADAKKAEADRQALGEEDKAAKENAPE